MIVVQMLLSKQDADGACQIGMIIAGSRPRKAYGRIVKKRFVLTGGRDVLAASFCLKRIGTRLHAALVAGQEVTIRCSEADVQTAFCCGLCRAVACTCKQ